MVKVILTSVRLDVLSEGDRNLFVRRHPSCCSRSNCPSCALKRGPATTINKYNSQGMQSRTGIIAVCWAMLARTKDRSGEVVTMPRDNSINSSSSLGLSPAFLYSQSIVKLIMCTRESPQPQNVTAAKLCPSCMPIEESIRHSVMTCCTGTRQEHMR